MRRAHQGMLIQRPLDLSITRPCWCVVASRTLSPDDGGNGNYADVQACRSRFELGEDSPNRTGHGLVRVTQQAGVVHTFGYKGAKLCTQISLGAVPPH